MPWPRHLLAILFVTFYGLMSTFGMGLVKCVEGDGSRNIEALGAACCSLGVAGVAGAEDAASQVGASDSGDGCRDCQAHLPAIDATAIAQSSKAPRPTVEPASASALPVVPAGLVAGWIDLRSAELRAPPPRPSATVVCLRTVVLRC